MVPTLEKRIDRYVGGLPSCIQGIVLAANPATLESAISLSAKLTNIMVKSGELKDDSGKVKEEQPKKKQKGIQQYAMPTPLNQVAAVPAKAARKPYTGVHPQCAQCQFHHAANMPCRQCTNCGRKGHMAQHCRTSPTPAVNNATMAKPPPQNLGNYNNNNQGCFNCGELGHFSRNCPKRAQPGDQIPRGRAFMIGTPAAHQDPEKGTGM